MASLPYIQLYVGDYLKDTMHLSTVEHGAYLLLIMNYWTSANALRSDSERLSKIVKMTVEEFEKIKKVLSEFFVEEDGLWIHPRIEEDLFKAESKSKKASSSAKIKSANAQRTHSERSAISSSDIRYQISDNKKIYKKDFDEKIISEKDEAVVFMYWVSKDKSRHSAIFDKARKSAISKMLKHFSIDEMKLAIDGCALSPFHNGDNKYGAMIDGVENIFKSASQVEKFIEMSKNPPVKQIAEPENNNNKYEEFLEREKCERSKKFVEILKRAEAECRYNLTIEEVNLHYRSLKSFSLELVSGAFDDFHENRTPYDGKFPKPRLLLDFVHQREKIMKGVAEQSWRTILYWIDQDWKIAEMNPSKTRTIMIDNQDFRKQLPDRLEDFKYNDEAKEKFIELFLKTEEVEK